MSDILVVCRANLRRSQIAAAMLRQGFQGVPGLATSGVRVLSAGLSATPGGGLEEQVVLSAARVGLRLETCSARRVDLGCLATASVILTATRHQAQEVARLSPDVARRTFTLAQIGRIATTWGSEVDLGAARDARARLDGLLEAAPGLRRKGIVTRDDDLRDVERLSRRSVARLIEQTWTMVAPVLACLTAAPPGEVVLGLAGGGGWTLRPAES